MLSIEKAKREDARAAWETRNAAILDQCAGHYSMDVLRLWTSGELPEELIETVAKHFYVATHSNQIVGTKRNRAQSGPFGSLSSLTLLVLRTQSKNRN